MRRVTCRYDDPLDRVWLTAAERVGLRVRRSADAFASTDGRGTLIIGSAETLDPDDCLAQMIFHELCHSLVQGPESFAQPDWGLDNEGARDLVREHACLRLQAFLSRRHGLRDVLAPTTEHRAFYDALGEDPLEGGDASVALARAGVSRAERDPWGPHLSAALEASAAIASVVSAHLPRPPIGVVPDDAPPAALPPLYADVQPALPRHPTGRFVHAVATRTCADCAWNADGVCAGTDLVDPAWPACERFEASVVCEDCGACCREAYHQLELAPDDPFVARHADLVERVDGRLALRRVDGRCPPLRGDGSEATPYTCALYDERPRTCREFTRGSAHCLEARRRMGRSI